MFACPPAYFASHKRWGAFALNGFPFLLFVVFFANGALTAAFLWWLLSVADVLFDMSREGRMRAPETGNPLRLAWGLGALLSGGLAVSSFYIAFTTRKIGSSFLSCRG